MKIRSVRPEFFTDPKMAGLSHSARLLYIGLWCYVDDEGRGEFLPKRIEGEIFPLEDVDFAALWLELEGLGRVVRYEENGQEYFFIPTSSAHQKPNRKYESKLPAPNPHTAHALREQGVPPVHAPPVEGEGEGDVASSREFTQWHARRAADAVRDRQRRGLAVKSERGLAKAISEDVDFLTESKRLWAHRHHKTCRGSGFVEAYAPGAGTVRNPCTEGT